jgi:hypothetical protein
LRWWDWCTLFILPEPVEQCLVSERMFTCHCNTWYHRFSRLWVRILRNHGSTPGRFNRCFFCPKHLGQLLGSACYSVGTRVFLPHQYCYRGIKLTSCEPVSRLRLGVAIYLLSHMPSQLAWRQLDPSTSDSGPVSILMWKGPDLLS